MSRGIRVALIVVFVLAVGVLVAHAGGHAHGHHSTAVAPAPTPETDVTVTEAGFVPSEIPAKKGEPVRLVVTRKTDRTCAKEIVVKDYDIRKELPLDKAVVVAFTPTKAGRVRFACGMDMVSGVVVVQ